jgi:hypothetical protein
MGGVLPLRFPPDTTRARPHLAWAVIFSLLLHLLLIAGTPSFEWGAPAEEPATALTARLVPLPPPAREAAAPLPPPRPAPRRPAPLPSVAAPEAPAAPPTEPAPPPVGYDEAP